jgi:hypothetical protein
MDLIQAIGLLISKLQLWGDLKEQRAKKELGSLFEPTYVAMRTTHKSYCDILAVAQDGFRRSDDVTHIAQQLEQLRRMESVTRHELMGKIHALRSRRDLGSFQPFVLAIHRYLAVQPDFFPRTRLSMARDFISAIHSMEDGLELVGHESQDALEGRKQFAEAIGRLILDLEERWKRIAEVYLEAVHEDQG